MDLVTYSTKGKQEVNVWVNQVNKNHTSEFEYEIYRINPSESVDKEWWEEVPQVEEEKYYSKLSLEGSTLTIS